MGHVDVAGVRYELPDGRVLLEDTSFRIGEGAKVALVGANGAGKSSTMHAISALLKVASGHIYFEEQEITKLSADQIVKLGVIQVPEGRQIFTKLSVEENLRMGAYTKKNKEEIKRNHELVMDLFPILRQRRTQSAGTLSGGEQQMLAISRAMMASPRMLLLDEPSMGLSPILTQQVFGVLKELGKNGITIFLIEQNAYDALEISDRSYIMESGRITLEGISSDLIEDKRVKDAYLGGNV